MRHDYEYASMRMALELEQSGINYELRHYQYMGEPEDLLTKLTGTVYYKERFTGSELDLLMKVLIERPLGKSRISKKFYVLRKEEKYSMLRLKFSQALETVPLPKQASLEFVRLIQSVVGS
jgi:hypothetical protein